MKKKTIETTSGTLSGVEIENGITVIRGIPYAAPPVGELRWRPPQPPVKWTGIRACEKFGDVAWQDMSRRTNPPSMNEDCLYLNIWSGNMESNAKRPVMVWIHGGGLNQGWSSQAKYDGAAFAKAGAVLVSLNYRLGALGFLAHPGLSAESSRGISGNYGLLDQVESLKWIQKNIARFGGDPKNVTIFGESAGGTSVATLCASPLAKGLFHRAIMQSPWMGSPHAMEVRYVFGTLGPQASESDHAVSRTMVRYWSQFAKTGNPNADGLVQWPAYDEDKSYLKISERCVVDRQLGKRVLRCARPGYYRISLDVHNFVLSIT